MTVTVAELLGALRAQAAELASPGGSLGQQVLAQQLLHQARTRTGDEALARPAANRLHRLARIAGDPALNTLWTSSRARRRLASGFGEITALALSPDGAQVAFAAADHFVRLVPTAGTQVRPTPLGVLRHWVSALAWGADGTWFVTGDHAGDVVEWRRRGSATAGGYESRLLGRHHDYVRSVVVDRNDGSVFSVGDDGFLMRWDRGGGEGGRRIGEPGRGCLALAVDPATGLLCTGGRGGEVRRWDPEQGDGASTLMGLHGPVQITALVTGPGSKVVSVGRDGTLLAWDASAPGAEPRPMGRAGPLTGGAAYQLAGPLAGVICGTTQGRVMHWTTDTGEERPRALGTHDRGVTAVSAEAGVTVTGGRDGFLMVWDRSDPEPAGPWDIEVWTVAVDPMGSSVVTGGTDGIHRWAPAGGGPGGTRAPKPELIWDSPVSHLAFLADGRLACGGEDGSLLVRDPAAPADPPVVVRPPDGRRRTVRHLAAVLGGTTLLTVMADGDLLLWPSGDPPAVGVEAVWIGRGSGGMPAVAPDGRWVITVGETGELTRWELERPGAMRTLGRVWSRTRALAVTADGARVVTGDDRGRLVSWDATGLEPGGRLLSRRTGGAAPTAEPTAKDAVGAVRDGRGPSRIRSIAVAPDGSWVASVNDAGLVECWDTRTGRHTGLLPKALPRVVTSWDGRLLVADRHGGLTLLEVMAVAAATPTVTPLLFTDPEVTLVVDQQWCNRASQGRLLDFGALRADLSGGRPHRAVVPCPEVSELDRFRGYLRATGWSAPLVKPGRSSLRAAILEEVAEAVAAARVVVVTGDPELRRALGAVGCAERLTFVDSVERWLAPGAGGPVVPGEAEGGIA
ncbi:WD40 repeat domain-containing protein [Streptomyces clavifer]|uniref:WD40 repeat domain-containing protein n=1 Tax=Streptomyces clavifer TaxID=68188 RepID=UPI002E800731|nr:WD40 repeat domain-containing protein [Streptomyces clavifer]WUC31856.1 WD40 repeat domain-containing protein [Streptomyces clavifer]